jgi:arsenate reductase
MEEAGADISGNRSKHVDEFRDQPFDLVVTVCDGARESCPVFPAARAMDHWPFEDPASARGTDDEKLRVFRKVRDQIEARIRAYLAGS